jgi:hypothetical protein
MMQHEESDTPARTNRRSVMTGFGLASGAWLVGSTARAEPPAPSTPPRLKGVYSVAAFGAVGDGKTDDTAAIQKALNAAGLSGGIVALPVGTFLVEGHLIVHANVTLEGLFRSPTARSQGYGSTILAVGGNGKSDGEPLFSLKANAVLKGLAVFYPEQDAKNPVAYPWCVRGQGDNIAVIDVLLVNPWNAVDFGTYPCGRHFISGLHGQPLHTGLYVDQCLDCGRLENVHFWPFWTTEPLAVTREKGTAFRFARSDWQMVSNTFCLGYHTGFHFTAVRTDAGNALVLNSGADLCSIGVHVEYIQVQAGALFTNCQINAGVVVDAGSLGPVKFVNCGLFGTGFDPLPYLARGGVKASHVLHRGRGRMTFVGCHFYHPEAPFIPKGFTDAGHPVVYSDGNGLTLNGCDFTGFDRNHIRLGSKAKSTLVTGNRFLGGLKLDNAGMGKVVTGDNIDE